MTAGRQGADAPVPLVPGRMAAHTICVLQKLGQVVFRLMEAELAGLGLRVRHYSVLGTLLDRGSMSQQDIGGYLRIDAATMVATIDDLERLGLVRRKRRDGDRRSYVVSVTEAGEQTSGRIDDLMRRLDDEFLADITGPQQRQLSHVLGKLSAGPALTAGYDARGR
jgi:DNA-binding MarR family transcriptional regulator